MFSVCVITYNQENYISQTLDSILSQEHNYSYEIVIGDDCSTDGTRQVIERYVQKYPSIIKPLYNEKNLGLIKNYFNVIKHCAGKYIMECAGDDWWLPGKVTTQIEFMETHKDVGMCYGRAQVWNEKKGLLSEKTIGSKKETLKDLLFANDIPALTVCFRTSIIQNYMKEIQPETMSWLMEDYPLWLYISYNSRIKYIDKQISVYRIIEESVSHSKDINKMFLFSKSLEEIRSFYSKKYNVSYEKKSDEYLWFYIYVSELKKQYKKEFVILLRSSYKNIKRPSFSMKLYNICAFFPFFWKAITLFH